MGTTGTEIAPAAHTPCATASASHQLGSCHTTVSPGPMPCAWSSPATRCAAATSSLGIGAAAYSNVMWRTLPPRGETAAMDATHLPDPAIVVAVQDLFAQY